MAAGSGRANGVTVGDDPRITRLGAVLRHYKLDELPQLVNVLRGDMSLVGPRPEVPSYVERYTPAQRRVLSVRPGLTDPASLAFHDEAGLLATYPDPVWTYRETVLPRKIGLSLEYLSRRTIATDVAVLARTALLLLSSRRRAASPPPVQGDGASGP
jgi:lipopolysaccharide/colanic/teichoic acid biosynthesis glycosyltransferase